MTAVQGRPMVEIQVTEAMVDAAWDVLSCNFTTVVEGAPEQHREISKRMIVRALQVLPQPFV